MISPAAVKSGLSWQGASLGLQITVQLVVLALLARVVEPKAFGLVSAAYVAIDLCQVLSEAGASAAVIHRQKLDREFVGTAWSTSIAIGTFLCIVLSLVSTPISKFFGMMDLQPVLIALSCLFVLMGVARVPEALLQRELKFATLMKVNLTSQACGYALPAIVLGLRGFGVWALVTATLLQYTVKATLLWMITRGSHAPCFSSAALREMLAFGLGITKEKIWNYVIAQGDRFVIGRRLGAVALGQYYVMAVAMMPSRYFGDLIDNVFFPVMARMRNDRKRLGETWLNLVSNCFVFMFGVGVFLSANGETIVGIAFGDRWLEAAPVFQVLCLGAGFEILTRVSDSVNRALGQVHQTANRKMINALIFVPTVWLVAPFGLVAICSVLIFLQAVNALLQCRLALRGLDITWAMATPNVRHGITGLCLILILNGACYLVLKQVAGSGYGVLAASVVANVGVGMAFFMPVIRMWRGSDEPYVPRSH